MRPSRATIAALSLACLCATFWASHVSSASASIEGRSPSLSRLKEGLGLLFLAAPADATDIYFQRLDDNGQPLGTRERVGANAYDHGQNGAQLLVAPDGTSLYAVWNERTIGTEGSRIRFSARGSDGTWSASRLLNDDGKDISHSFQSATVGPDGTIYVGWLEFHGNGQDRTGPHPDLSRRNVTGGTSVLYLTTSRDGGRTFSPNVALARGTCPCCRVGLAASPRRVVLSWRDAQPGDIRDIAVRESTDSGRTWGAPASFHDDGWSFAGCPHQGALLQFQGDELFGAWFTQGKRAPGISLASIPAGRRAPASSAAHVHAGTDAAKLLSMIMAADGAAVAYRVGSAASVWTARGAAAISGNGAPTTGAVDQVALTTNRKGDVVAVWKEAAKDGPVLRVSVLPPASFRPRAASTN